MQEALTYTNVVEDLLRKAKLTEKPSKIVDLKKYIGTKYDFIGLSVPGQRAIFKVGYAWSNDTVTAQIPIWDLIWKTSTVYEVMNQALFFLLNNRKAIHTEVMWDITKTWVSRVDNWAHSDVLSDIYSSLLDVNPSLIYPKLVEWNHSENPWERRQSLVSLLEYSKKRKNILPVGKMLPLVLNLLNDPDIFVQKAVGWSLREIGNVYAKEVWFFLSEHCTSLSAIAFSSALEKRSKEEKEILKLMRKQHRINR